ncbi:MAG: hypothetical protein GQ527_00515 [Bacteroidales bacterium]|nr:hypothetical protein [Bacteroidales bacterium]
MFTKRVILTLIIALFISVIIGFMGNKIPTNELKKQLFVNKIHNSQTYDLLIIGDSRTFRGLSPKPFNDQLGLKSFNLGFSSVVFDNFVFDLIEQKLNKETKTPIIVVAITPHSLTKYSYPNGHIRAIKKMKREDVLIYKYFLQVTNVFSPYSISDLKNLLSGKSISSEGFQQTHYLDQGWIHSDYTTRQPNAALKSYNNTFKTRLIDSLVKDQLFNKVKHWKQKGYDIYGFIPPSSQNMETLERSYSGFSNVEMAERFIESGGKWILLDSVYRSYDGSHLAGEDAIRLSKVIAHKIKVQDVDSVYDKANAYANNYLPLEEPKNRYTYDFLDSKYMVESKNKEIIGKIDSSTLYFNFATISADSIIKKGVTRIIIQADFLIPDESVQFILAYKVKREKETSIHKKMSSKWILKEKKWGTITYEFELPEDLKSGDLIIPYIHNHQKNVFFIKGLETLLY